jgi:hypothetical protein
MPDEQARADEGGAPADEGLERVTEREVLGVPFLEPPCLWTSSVFRMSARRNLTSLWKPTIS